MNIKQRLQAIEALLIPPARKIIVRFFSVVNFDDATDLTAYRCNRKVIERIEGENLDDFKTRSKSDFIEQQQGKGVLFLEPIYTSDNNTTGG